MNISFDEMICSFSDASEGESLNKYFDILTAQNVKRYVVGRNEQSSDLITKYQISGLIDDFGSSSDFWNGIPVVFSKDLDLSAVIINCVTSISPIDLRKSLESRGFKNIIDISDLISDQGGLIDLPWFVREQREELRGHKAAWLQLYEMLADDESKRTLFDILGFRLSAKLEFMNAYCVRLKDQYFEDFMVFDQEVFVDAGGFDGDTTEEFINRYPNYRKIFLFEPSDKNLSAAKIRLNGRRDIHFRSVGLSNEEEVLYFNDNAGSASAISTGEGTAIRVVALDRELTNEAVTFIKMDLEGWEMKALYGAAEIIRLNRPKLAIAVYHTAKDFREISQFILNINPTYRIFLRHYTQGWSETVMFFL